MRWEKWAITWQTSSKAQAACNHDNLKMNPLRTGAP